jgi:DNA polymerase-3 subunit delta'
MFPKDKLHHAYFIEGDRDAVVAAVEVHLYDAFGIVRQGHPDVHFAVHEAFGVDESRELSSMQSLRPVMGDKKIFIVAVGSITSEAQNALLKVFEEPTPGTHFFVVSSSARILLPTLRSRMVVIVHESARTVAPADAKEFIRLSPKDRLAFVAPIIEEKDKARAEEFLQALVAELHKAGKTKAIREILPLIGYLKDRASSLKLILERVALLSF